MFHLISDSIRKLQREFEPKLMLKCGLLVATALFTQKSTWMLVFPLALQLLLTAAVESNPNQRHNPVIQIGRIRWWLGGSFNALGVSINLNRN